MEGHAQNTSSGSIDEVERLPVRVPVACGLILQLELKFGCAEALDVTTAHYAGLNGSLLRPSYHFRGAARLKLFGGLDVHH